MKKITKFISRSLFILFLAFGCNTKRIVLVTNVELEFSQSNVESGFVKELLPTTLTITPEAFLEEFVYTFSYEVLEGNGHFINEVKSDSVVPAGKEIVLSRLSDLDTEFVLNLDYEPLSSGVHKVQVTASDNFEKSFSETLIYTVADIPVTWEAISPITNGEETQEIPITLTFSEKQNNDNLAYSVVYSLTEGSGKLLDDLQNEVKLGRELPINFGVQNFTYVSNQPGTNRVSFTLTDSNQQVINSEVVFEISEFVIDNEPPVILPLGDNPLTILTGSTYTDPGATASDNKDDTSLLTATIETQGVSEINTAVPGEFIVTYSVTDRGGNAASAERKVVVKVNNTDVPFFSIKGNATDQKTFFDTRLKPGERYTPGTFDNLTDNGTVEPKDQIINDPEKISNTNIKFRTTKGKKYYTVTYAATDNDGNTTTMEERIYVIDNAAPQFAVADLKGKAQTSDFTTYIEYGDSYEFGKFINIMDNGIKADELLTVAKIENPNSINIGIAKIKATPYVVTYSITDLEGNTTEIKETITVSDKTVPTFAVKSGVNGTVQTKDFTTKILVGEPYQVGIISEAKDLSGVSEEITGQNSISTNVVRSYTVQYIVSDLSPLANQKIITETVTVEAINSPPTFKVGGINYEPSQIANFQTFLIIGESYEPKEITDIKDDKSINDKGLVTFEEEIPNPLNAVGTFKVFYSVIDSDGLKTTVTELVNVKKIPIFDKKTGILNTDSGLKVEFKLNSFVQNRKVQPWSASLSLESITGSRYNDLTINNSKKNSVKVLTVGTTGKILIKAEYIGKNDNYATFSIKIGNWKSGETLYTTRPFPFE